LRPDCPAKDRLLQWRPSQPASIDDALSQDDAARISLALGEAFRDSTKATYAAGLKLYMDLCDTKGIPNRNRIPASNDLISLFVSQLVGAYSASAAKNYFAGVRAWHIIHRYRWTFDGPLFTTLLNAAKASAPKESKAPKKEPYTLAVLEALFRVLDLNSSRDAAVAAAASIAFYSLARAGELTVRSLKEFDPKVHVTTSNLGEDRDRFFHDVTTLRIPRTKVAIDGQTICWAKQDGLTDPYAALENHLRINKPEPHEHLFTHWAVTPGKSKKVPLTIKALRARLKTAAITANVKALQGHTFRVGGTLEYLLRGVPFEVVKSHGRWKGEAFQLYLRRHAQIIAPYIQARPEAHVEFV
ncbi:hypothetical protein BC629DRAFT_1249024, partial [Irpex lacteus]